jgi:hypothetical protein
MILELVATFCSALFAGAAIYVNLVEHPARMECGTSVAVQEWRPSYRRASIMQASLAAVGLLSATGAWIAGRGIVTLLAGITLGIVIPFTLVVIAPTNTKLKDPALDTASPEVTALLSRWNRLHMVRSVAALLAFVVLLLHLGELL